MGAWALEYKCEDAGNYWLQNGADNYICAYVNDWRWELWTYWS
jgi:hypothetical protein